MLVWFGGVGMCVGGENGEVGEDMGNGDWMGYGDFFGEWIGVFGVGKWQLQNIVQWCWEFECCYDGWWFQKIDQLICLLSFFSVVIFVSELFVVFSFGDQIQIVKCFGIIVMMLLLILFLFGRLI